MIPQKSEGVRMWVLNKKQIDLKPALQSLEPVGL